MPTPGEPRRLTGFLGTVVVGIFVVYILISDVGFALLASRGMATVTGVTPGGRSGITFGDVDLDLPGGSVKAELRAWYTRIAVGDTLPVVYRRDELGMVVLNRRWDLYFRPRIGLLVLGIVTVTEANAFKARRRAWRHRSSLLRE